MDKIHLILSKMRATAIYRPLRVGEALFRAVYDELKEHEKLVGKDQRFAVPDRRPNLLIANTPVYLDASLSPNQIEVD